MKCVHEAWEESASSRKCADCGEWLEPIVKPAAEFQVGDRVSVEGVVTAVQDVTAVGELVTVRLGPNEDYMIALSTERMTLIERPRRKLRVGSVWEHNYIGKKAWIVGQRAGADLFVPLDGLGAALLRSQTNFDTDPQDWREVPVEELAREAGA